MELSEFLLARIAEDEETVEIALKYVKAPIHAEWLAKDGRGMSSQFTPARVLVECEAKRRIVEWLLPPSGLDEEGAELDWAARDGDRAQQVAIGTLRLLALPYADHPDYREVWRP